MLPVGGLFVPHAHPVAIGGIRGGVAAARDHGRRQGAQTNRGERHAGPDEHVGGGAGGGQRVLDLVHRGFGGHMHMVGDGGQPVGADRFDGRVMAVFVHAYAHAGHLVEYGGEHIPVGVVDGHGVLQPVGGEPVDGVPVEFDAGQARPVRVVGQVGDGEGGAPVCGVVGGQHVQIILPCHAVHAGAGGLHHLAGVRAPCQHAMFGDRERGGILGMVFAVQGVPVGHELGVRFAGVGLVGHLPGWGGWLEPFIRGLVGVFAHEGDGVGAGGAVRAGDLPGLHRCVRGLAAGARHDFHARARHGGDRHLLALFRGDCVHGDRGFEPRQGLAVDHEPVQHRQRGGRILRGRVERLAYGDGACHGRGARPVQPVDRVRHGEHPFAVGTQRVGHMRVAHGVRGGVHPADGQLVAFADAGVGQRVQRDGLGQCGGVPHATGPHIRIGPVPVGGGQRQLGGRVVGVGGGDDHPHHGAMRIPARVGDVPCPGAFAMLALGEGDRAHGGVQAGAVRQGGVVALPCGHIRHGAILGWGGAQQVGRVRACRPHIVRECERGGGVGRPSTWTVVAVPAGSATWTLTCWPPGALPCGAQPSCCMVWGGCV